MYVPLYAPLLPPITSYKAELARHGPPPWLPPTTQNKAELARNEPTPCRTDEVFPAIAYTLAMIGELRLVPPTTSHPSKRRVSYAATPVGGSATAATSATVRRSQSRSFCQPGLRMYAEQPLVEPAHA